MDQKQIGLFLKELRKQKGLTQGQLAEMIGVSDRSISRWENGKNMPDLSILVELADYYEIDIREIINGERKGENMNRVIPLTNYNKRKARKTRILCGFFSAYVCGVNGEGVALHGRQIHVLLFLVFIYAE